MTMSPCTSVFTESSTRDAYGDLATVASQSARLSTRIGSPPVVHPSPCVKVNVGADAESTKPTSPRTTAASISRSKASTSAATSCDVFGDAARRFVDAADGCCAAGELAAAQTARTKQLSKLRCVMYSSESWVDTD